MTREQYNLWRNDPVTLFYRKFLKDRKEALIHEATAQWLNGSPVFERDNQVDRGRIAELLLVEDLAFEVIENFYWKEEDDTQADQDGPR